MTAHVKDKYTEVVRVYEGIKYLESFDTGIYFLCNDEIVWVYLGVETVEFDI